MSTRHLAGDGEIGVGADEPVQALSLGLIDHVAIDSKRSSSAGEAVLRGRSPNATNSTIPRWSSKVTGYSICVIHFIGHARCHHPWKVLPELSPEPKPNLAPIPSQRVHHVFVSRRPAAVLRDSLASHPAMTRQTRPLPESPLRSPSRRRSAGTDNIRATHQAGPYASTTPVPLLVDYRVPSKRGIRWNSAPPPRSPSFLNSRQTKPRPHWPCTSVKPSARPLPKPSPAAQVCMSRWRLLQVPFRSRFAGRLRGALNHPARGTWGEGGISHLQSRYGCLTACGPRSVVRVGVRLPGRDSGAG